MRNVVIAGGGLAGAAASAALAKAGVDVTILERETGPADKICGEFLSTEAQRYLAQLGLDLAPLGGHPINALLLVKGARSAATRLPFQGIGISRKTLDEALLNHAAACGAKIIRGHAVKSVSVADGVVLDVEGIGAITPQTLLLATGKHELRGARRNAVTAPDLVGFKMYFRLREAAMRELAGHIALIMFRRGYAGLQMVEDGQANLCLLAERGNLRESGGKFSDLLAALCAESPRLAGLLAGAEPLLAQPLSIYRVPYGYIHKPRASDPPNLFRLGDQAGVIPSFTGDGMAVALHSAALAAAMVLRGGTAMAYHRRLAHDITGQIRRAGALYRLASARPAQEMFFRLAQAWPQSLQWAAQLTRVPARVLLSQ